MTSYSFLLRIRIDALYIGFIQVQVQVNLICLRAICTRKFDFVPKLNHMTTLVFNKAESKLLLLEGH